MTHVQVAWLQNAGHKGLSSTSLTVVGLSGAGAGFLVGLLLSAVGLWIWSFRNKRRKYDVPPDSVPLADRESMKELPAT